MCLYGGVNTGSMGQALKKSKNKEIIDMQYTEQKILFIVLLILCLSVRFVCRKANIMG